MVINWMVIGIGCCQESQDWCLECQYSHHQGLSMVMPVLKMTRNVTKRVIFDIEIITKVIPMVIFLGQHNHQKCAKNGLDCCKDGFLDGQKRYQDGDGQESQSPRIQNLLSFQCEKINEI